MPGNKRGRGRAGKASRYRAANPGSSTPLGQDYPQAIASQFLPRIAQSNGFSMGDTLKNTARHRDDAHRVGNLRSNPVRFVSAGVVEPLKELNQELCATTVATDSGQNGVDVQEVAAAIAPIHQGLEPSKAPVHSDAQPSRENSVFFVDTAGDRSLAQCQVERVQIPRPDSPKADTDSGEDVILFTGRKCRRPDEHRSIATDEINISVQQVEIDLKQISLETPAEPTALSASPVSIPSWQLRGHNDDDAIVADYIANMVEDDEDDDEANKSGDDFARTLKSRSRYQSFIQRSLGGLDNEFNVGSDSDGDDSLLNDGENGSDNPEANNAEYPGFDGASDMDDETLARLLAKQEELGISDEELVLFSADGFAGTYRPASDSIPTSQQGISSGKRGKVKGKGRQHAPSASAVADVFDELDLMDWGRHNPPRRSKSKRGQPDFNLSDSELEATLEAVWQKDRLRKREKKQQREELRAQGLLGKNADSNDPRVKYPTHITFDQIKEEMRGFLLGNEPTIFFPPMDSHARKVIHELANKFNIKSKSAGSGDQRRPALHRTLRTVKYREVYFEEVFARSGRKYFARPDVRPRGGPRNKGESSGGGRMNGGRGGGGGGKGAAFTYKDGEVVGASAPELGATNKGRNMLEKMGWSTGMALGAVDNKGILQPVPHVVKRTKAGLG